MPLRVAPFRAALHLQPHPAGPRSPRRGHPPQQRRLFHATGVRPDDTDGRNHYETLKVATNASPADIKKSFYALSKTHHPDHNPDDPRAPRRFMRISEAYNVLGDTAQRARYDRDVLRLHEGPFASSSSHPHARPGGSYASTGPAGGRPASGLSRRRGTFRGPPPSFYTAGGWGAHGAKRSAAHDESAGAGGGSAGGSADDARERAYQQYHDQQRQQQSYAEWYHSAGNTGGMGPGQAPFGGAGAEMPHFDRAAQQSHTRTQEHVDARRAAAQRARRAAEGSFASASSDFSEAGGFFVILAILGVAVAVPYFIMRGWGSGKKKEKKEK